MANSAEIIPFWLFLDINHLRPVYVLGSIVSYLAIIFNIFIVGILCQNLFFSPSTVLIQGLALADGLTALFTYGFEPFFVSKYDENFYLLLKSVTSEEVRANVFVTLGYPDCKFYLLTNHLAECCHLISVCFTMCIGLQKVVAMRFPIWTRIKLTVWKSVICSVLSFSFISHMLNDSISTDCKESAVIPGMLIAIGTKKHTKEQMTDFQTVSLIRVHIGNLMATTFCSPIHMVKQTEIIPAIVDCCHSNHIISSYGVYECLYCIQTVHEQSPPTKNFCQRKTVCAIGACVTMYVFGIRNSTNIF
jgi:hypothetical protein